MRVDRNAAPVVGHGQKAVRRQLHFDEGRMACQRLVHRVVDHLGEQMMQRLFISPADIHSRPAADGFQPFQNLDILCGITFLCPGGAGGRLGRGSGTGRHATEQVVASRRFLVFIQGFGHMSLYSAE